MDRAAGHGGGDLHSRIKVICNGAARTFVRAAPRYFFPSKESIYNSLIYISSTAPEVSFSHQQFGGDDERKFRRPVDASARGSHRVGVGFRDIPIYPPFSIFSFMDCLTASGVTAASRTVSTVCKRRVSRPSVLTFAAACGTVGLPIGIVVDVSDVLAGACTLADELPVGLFFVI